MSRKEEKEGMGIHARKRKKCQNIIKKFYVGDMFLAKYKVINLTIVLNYESRFQINKN